jgi:hypothetical protein
MLIASAHFLRTDKTLLKPIYTYIYTLYKYEVIKQTDIKKAKMNRICIVLQQFGMESTKLQSILLINQNPSLLLF